MSDTPFPLPEDGVASRVLAAFDAEAKIPRALDALGPIAGRDVVVVDAGRPAFRIGQIAELGGRVIVAGDPEATGLPDASADVVVSFWDGYRPPADAAVAEADRVLRPGGRLMLVRDYGRDDHVRVEPAIADETVAWSRRDGWYLTHGFRVRVIHAFWTFADLDEARELLAAAFGPAGDAVAAGLTRPRISHNVAVYHRNRGGIGPSPVVRPEREEREASHPAPGRDDPERGGRDPRTGHAPGDGA